MGGLFRAPKPTIVQPAPVAAPTPTVAPPSPTAEQAGQQARAAAQTMAQSGIEGTIATSPTGVLTPLSAVAGARKSLLGE